MPRYLPLDTVRRVALRALANGGTCRVTHDGLAFIHHVDWNVAGRCHAPVTVELHGRPYADKRSLRTGGVPPQARLYFVTIEAKCRKCERCLMDRAAHWRMRAISEWSQAPRSWLITTTFTHAYQLQCLQRARNKFKGAWVKDPKNRKGKILRYFEELPEAEQFQLHHNETQKELTLFFKRLRKAECLFRYLLVAEKHESGGMNHGFPHYHVVLHELIEGSVRHADIKDKWRVGFVDAKLIHDTKSATYACKYLTKSALARVRASQNYGGHEYAPANTASSPRRVLKIAPCLGGCPEPNGSEGKEEGNPATTNRDRQMSDQNVV